MRNAVSKLCKVCLVSTLVLAPASVFAQGVVKGTVLDTNNEPVIGASVIEKGNPKNGTVTDIDGNFTLNLKSGKTAVISYIGMVTQEIKGDGQKQTVILKDDNSQLNDVVVVGYTSKARKDLTGSVGSISGQKLAIVPVASAAEALAGKIAGVQVTTVDGAPGADINIRIRGGSAISDNQNSKPLYIVDGFQADNINDIPLPTFKASTFLKMHPLRQSMVPAAATVL